MLFITPLRSYIAFSKHGSVWNPIKKVIFSTKMGSAIVTSRRTLFWYCLEPFFLRVYVLWCRTELYSVSHLHWLLAVEHMSSPLRHHLSKNKNTRAQNRINESSAICWSTQGARNQRLATSFQLYPQICFHFLWLSVSWLSNLPENVVSGLNFIAMYFDKTTNNNILAFSVLSLSHHTEKARSPSVINDVSHTNKCSADCASRTLLWCSAVHETCTLHQHISTPAASAGETPQSTVK